MARDKYICQVCLPAGLYSPADEVDHIVPQAEGGTDAEDNLQAICRRCHDVKTKAEIARGANRSHPRRGEKLNADAGAQIRGEGRKSEGLPSDTGRSAKFSHGQN